MGVAQQILAAGGGFSPLAGATAWNPADKSSSTTLSNGDLTFTRDASGAGGVRALVGRTSGKYYWEITINNSAGVIVIGAIGGETSLTGSLGGYGFAWRSTTGGFFNGSGAPSPGSYTTGDVLMIAFDRTNSLVYVGKNGSWYGSMDPSAGTGGVSVSISGATYPNAEVTGSGGQITANFGATPFNYSVPTGFTPGFA